MEGRAREKALLRKKDKNAYFPQPIIIFWLTNNHLVESMKNVKHDLRAFMQK